MRDFEQQLRDAELRHRREQDPGDLFWARLPGKIWTGITEARARRARRLRWLRRAGAGVAALAAAGVILFELRLGTSRAPTSTPRPTTVTELAAEPPEVDEAPWILEPAALAELARELNEAAPELADETNTDDLPIEVLLDRMSESELKTLEAQLRG